MPDFVWRQGDAGPALYDTLSYSDGTPIPLAGKTVTFRLRSLTSAKVATLQATPTITNVDGGIAFTPTATDTTNLAVGNYIAEWHVAPENLTYPTDGYLWGRVEPSAATAPQLIVSVPDVKEHLGLPVGDRSRDSRLMDLIQAITPLIEAEVGPVVPKVYEEWHDGGSNLIELYRRPSSGFGTSPVFDLIAASEYRGAAEFPLALVGSPAFGSIYSVFLNAESGTLTRRAPGGSVMPFMPGRDTTHVVYRAGQQVTPLNVAFAAKECVRVAYEWTRQTGRGSQAPADAQEVGQSLSFQLSRMVRTMVAPTRRAPSFA